jgi:hypothetical protein
MPSARIPLREKVRERVWTRLTPATNSGEGIQQRSQENQFQQPGRELRAAGYISSLMSMSSPTTDEASRFPVARCEVCGRPVLTYLALDDELNERRYCADCDSPLFDEPERISAEQLEETGYTLQGQRKTGGCSGGGGCGGSCSVKKR